MSTTTNNDTTTPESAPMASLIDIEHHRFRVDALNAGLSYVDYVTSAGRTCPAIRCKTSAEAVAAVVATAVPCDLIGLGPDLGYLIYPRRGSVVR